MKNKYNKSNKNLFKIANTEKDGDFCVEQKKTAEYQTKETMEDFN